jgi:hypothetical protein
MMNQEVRIKNQINVVQLSLGAAGLLFAATSLIQGWKGAL